MLKKILLVLLILAFVTASASASSKNFFSQLLNAYQTYQEVNMLLWLTGDVNAEKRLGKELQFWQGLTSKPEKDKAINAYVKGIFDKITPNFKNHGMKFTIQVLRDNTANAFVIPGGHVYIYTGMLDMVTSDDELAAVISHELAHAQMRHSLKNFRLSTAMVEILKRAVKNPKDRESWGTVLSYLTLMKFSRTQEDEADDIGQTKMLAAGYNPSAQVTLWEKFLKKYGDTKGIAQYLSSHPPSAQRIQNAKTNLTKMNTPYSETFTNTKPQVLVEKAEKAEAQKAAKKAAANLIKNPDFEDAVPGKGKIAGWSIEKGNFRLSQTQAKSGKQSLENYPLDRFTIPKIYSEYIAVNEKSDLMFKAWCKSSDGKQKAAIGIEFYDKDHKLRDRLWVKEFNLVSSEWKSYEIQLKNSNKKILLKNHYAYLRIFFQAGPGAKGSVWFDNVELIAR
ncbi:MAG: Metalloprotease LoiP precursor [bacterium ADurb.Bin157]|nr:MAG: Metalloprotease LoiP precursor [bacterium ADurb.Bin157]